jgi:hypothetical protein
MNCSASSSTCIQFFSLRSQPCLATYSGFSPFLKPIARSFHGLCAALHASSSFPSAVASSCNLQQPTGPPSPPPPPHPSRQPSTSAAPPPSTLRCILDSTAGTRHLVSTRRLNFVAYAAEEEAKGRSCANGGGGSPRGRARGRCPLPR